MLALLGLGMILTFMALIMSKKMTAFTSLIIVPLVFGVIGGFGPSLGKFALSGLKDVTTTGAMLLFAILFFGIMINAGLFDPLVKLTLKFAKGDPLKVLVGTAVLAALVSLDGDGATTTMICCSALVPVYKKLKMKPLYLASIIIMQNSIMNLIPWGGPTARVMSVLKLDGGEVLKPLIPGMILSIIFVIFVAAYLGLKERKRLGVIHLDASAFNEMAATSDSEELALKRPKLIWLNFALTALVIFSIAKEIFPSSIVFAIGAAVAIMINYPKLKEQRKVIENHAGSVMQVLIMVLAAGVFLGILRESKMGDALAHSLISIVPQSMGPHFAFITALISIPGTFFLSNDAFYYGILPVLAETGATYGFTSLQIGVASLMGQAFHLLSPLVGFIYLLLQLTEVDMGEWQRFVAKWAIGIFAIFVAVAVITGFMPL